jgi:uridine phosphorylase
MDEMLYHIQVKKNSDLPRYLITCGDPGRAKRIASEFLDNSVELAKNREYHSYIGFYKGVKLLVSSMGIGSPSTAIGLEEFAMAGVDTFIRVGTSGSLSPSITNGSIVNATGAIRDEGTSKQYVPVEYPAIASTDVVLALREASKTLKMKKYYEGLVHSKDSFYSEHPEYTTFPDFVKARWSGWTKANVLATEMECSVLFVLAQLRKWRAGSVVAVIGSTWEESPISLNHKSGQTEAIQCALEAMKVLSEKDTKKS